MERMEHWQNTEAMIGTVTGPFQSEILVCQRRNHMINSLGVWYSNPLDSAMPVLMFQIILVFFITRILFLLLKPLRPSLTVTYILAGIVIGPSIFGQNSRYLAEVFPPGGITILMTFSQVGYLIHLFSIGVQVDTGILWRAEKSELIIGTMCFFSPYAVAYLSYYALKGLFNLDDSLSYSIPYIAIINSLSSYPVITSLLTDLRILNSDLGRFASHVSLVCDLLTWSLSLLANAANLAFHRSTMDSMWSILFTLMFISIIIFIIRPVTIWSSRCAQDGEEERVHFFEIMVILLGCSLLSEILGQHSSFGAYLMGWVLPHGPPFGTTLVQKVETVSDSLMVPAFLAVSGVRTHLSSLVAASSGYTQVIIVMSYVGKFSGTLVASVVCGKPFWDAVPLSLIMCCKGIIEVAVYCAWYDRKIIDQQVFAQLVVTMVIVTTLVRPLVAYLYDPSSRYMVHGRRALPLSKEGVKVQILVCLHNEDNVPTIMNLLEASNPTPHSPISVFVLHLEELKGRCAAVLVPHHHLDKSASEVAGSDHVVNAFTNYEQRSCGSAVVQHFTAISPFESMHDDVCALALDKRTHLIIMPFHKTWAIDGTVGFVKYAFRNVNKNVMGKAPCSVGVLIGRGSLASTHHMVGGEAAPYRVFVLFLGGADDREALAYSMRMVDHPSVSLTIIWIRSREDENHGGSQLDKEAMGDFRAKVGYNRNVKYVQQMTEDGVGTVQVIRSVETVVDLLIVGKHHDPSSPLVLGLTDWSENPELGVIGDLLATSDFQFSVLVVQREPTAATSLPFIEFGNQEKRKFPFALFPPTFDFFFNLSPESRSSAVLTSRCRCRCRCRCRRRRRRRRRRLPPRSRPPPTPTPNPPPPPPPSRPSAPSSPASPPPPAAPSPAVAPGPSSSTAPPSPARSPSPTPPPASAATPPTSASTTSPSSPSSSPSPSSPTPSPSSPSSPSSPPGSSSTPSAPPTSPSSSSAAPSPTARPSPPSPSSPSSSSSSPASGPSSSRPPWSAWPSWRRTARSGIPRICSWTSRIPPAPASSPTSAALPPPLRRLLPWPRVSEYFS